MYNDNNNLTNQDTSVMTLGQWMLTLLIIAIPCVNIVMLFVWGFGAGNENRKNYCRAVLIFAGIGIVIYFLLIIVLGLSMASLSQGSY